MEANICCSIEMEPKTLNQGQLNRAREVAADVVQKMEPANEASIVFIDDQGSSRPIILVSKNDNTDADDRQRKLLMEEEKQLIYKPVECEEIKTNHMVMKRPCQCLCISTINNIIDSSDQTAGLKEPLSAPF